MWGCVCVCVSRWAWGCAVRSAPERMCVCVPLSDHRSFACMCVHAREHTCDVEKGRAYVQREVRIFSLCVWLCEGQCICNRARLRCHVRRGKWLVMHARPDISEKQSYR